MKKPFQSKTKSREPVFARTSVARDADPIEKGYAFEQFVVSMFDHNKYFTLLEWRSDKRLGKIAPISNRNPDLELEFDFKGVRKSFAVECKYQYFLPTGKFAWANPYQLDNYQRFAVTNFIAVFVVLGFGGNAGSPEAVYCIPLKELVSIYIDEAFLAPFQHNLSANFFFDPETGLLT